LFVLRLKNSLKLNIVMVVISSVVGVYLIEISLNFPGGPFSEKTFKDWAAEAGVEFDTRSRYQVYQDLKNEGVDAVPLAHPGMYGRTNGLPGAEPLLPLGGVSRKITIAANETGKFMIYLSDRYGFNNPDSEWDSSKTEWLLTGDSFTHGASVQPGEDIGGQIRSITGEHVINLGIGGNGPLPELAVIKEYAESRRPKTLLWIYTENDLMGLKDGLALEKEVPLLRSYLHPEFSQKLIYRQTEIDDRIRKHILEKVMTLKNKLLVKTRMLRLFKLRKRIKLDNRQLKINIDPLFSKILAQARDQTAAWGGKLYFVYIPHHHRYANDVQDHDLYKKRGDVINVVKNLNISVIDIHQEVLSNHSDPLSFYPFGMKGHLTAGGNSEVAKAIVSRVTRDLNN
jgi:hypothetical protein